MHTAVVGMIKPNDDGTSAWFNEPALSSKIDSFHVQFNGKHI